MTIDEMMAILQAYKEGKTLERYDLTTDEWYEITDPVWDFYHTDYRIKPEPHYRPFESAEEVMEAIKEHGDWVKYDTYMDRIIGLEKHSVSILACNIDYTTAFKKFQFLDGTPFGKLVEE